MREVTQEIRQLTDAELEHFVPIAGNAYSAMRVHTPEDRERLLTRMRWLVEDPTIGFYGLYREGQLLGGMRLHDFTMNLHGETTHVGGVGMVAVDLAHKKEHVARDLIAYFLDFCRAHGWPLALLYPFRPDFYKQMGFGYGPKWSHYRVRPSALPNGGDKSRVVPLGPQDGAAVHDCYTRYAERTHGMIRKPARTIARMLATPEWRVFGYREGERVLGYFWCSVLPGPPDNQLLNDMQVGEFVYETPSALHALLTFLHTQADQFRSISFDLPDPNFHYLLGDPRNGSDHMFLPIYHESNTQGIGLMYRAVNVPRLFALLAERDFGGQTLTLTLTLHDNFLPANAGGTTLAFTNGHPEVRASGPADVELTLDVSDFSSLVVGAVDFQSLARLGLSTLSDPAYTNAINALFRVDAPPICTVEF
jgi:predicted acetyltransferase